MLEYFFANYHIELLVNKENKIIQNKLYNNKRNASIVTIIRL